MDEGPEFINQLLTSIVQNSKQAMPKIQPKIVNLHFLKPFNAQIV